MTRHVVTLYGLKSCDSCRKARAWLKQHQIAVQFHDFRDDGVPATQLGRWLAALGWQRVLNRRSSTWRQLDEARRNTVVDADSALALLLEHGTAIKRPVIEWSWGSPELTLGFAPEQWRGRLPH